MVSMVLFAIGLNTKMFGLRGCQLDKSAMCEMENVSPTVCGYFCL